MGKVATEATLREGVNLLRVIAKNQVNYYENHKAIQAIVRAGEAPNFFDIDDQIIETWNNGSTDYEMPMDIVAFQNVVNADGDTVPGMILQSHWALPGLQFDASEAIYVTETALPAGTYYFTFGTTWGSNVISGKSYYFTTTQEIPAGGQIMVGRNNEWYTWGAPDQAPANWRVHTFASNAATTPLESNLTLTEGTSGTSLGTITSTIKYSENGVNNLQRAGYGYNRWSQSAMRQWLNSDAATGGWWNPKNPFDRAPQQLASMRGFMAGLSADFLDIVNPIKVTTALNTVSDNEIGTTEDTFDRFWLASLEQEYCAPQLADVEGAYWPYWKDRLGLSSPQQWYGDHANANHIRYSISNHASAQYVRLRSAYRGNAHVTWSVNPSGSVSTSLATIVFCPAPACAIC